jgi:pimeloyl-ACP methyl ester carboxylesterase
MGWSLGGAYAAACAFALPDRVTALALVASIIPIDRPGALNELNRMDRSRPAGPARLGPTVG